MAGSPLAVIGCQCLPHVRLRNSELPRNLRWLDNWLTQDDVQNYGPELIDVTQSAASMR
jgi:hypothetical protein